MPTMSETPCELPFLANIFEPVHGKSQQFGFPTRYDTNRAASLRRWLEVGN